MKRTDDGHYEIELDEFDWLKTVKKMYICINKYIIKDGRQPPTHLHSWLPFDVYNYKEVDNIKIYKKDAYRYTYTLIKENSFLRKGAREMIWVDVKTKRDT